MLEIKAINLAADPDAARYLKTEIVTVTFARTPGELMSLEGPNRYEVGDALITGSTGTRWSVARRRFDEKYAALSPHESGADGQYQAKPLPVHAKQIGVPFTAARSAGGDVLRGEAGDWLLQYAPGDFGVCGNVRFSLIYKRL